MSLRPRAMERAAMATWVAPVWVIIGFITFPSATGWFILWWTLAGLVMGAVAAVATYKISVWRDRG